VATLDDATWPRRTERLVVRRATPADAAACWRFRRLPEVTDWLGTAHADEDAFTAWFTDPERQRDQLVVEHDGAVVGDAMVQVSTPWAQTEVADEAAGTEALLAWNLHPEVQGRGFATEVGHELLVVAFEDLGLRRVVAYCFADNMPSRRVMERLGMRAEARNVRDSLHRTRGWIDGMTYALLADEWRERRAAPAARRPSLSDVSWPRRTERLLIRRATPADAASVWRYSQRPEVSEWETSAHTDEESFTARWADPERLPMRLVVERDGVVVGELSLKVADGLAQAEAEDEARAVEADIGWSIDPDHQRQGYASEGAAELLRIAFEDLGLRRVTASCFADNTPSWRVMERIGMRRELTTRAEALHRTRGWLDGYGYALLADEWRAATARSDPPPGAAPG
jgi:RimJ/RimL family protein N-acetyltransferase